MRGSKQSEVRDKVVLITGGGKGLGAALAVELVRRGAKVAVVDIETSGPGHLAGGDVLQLKGDVTSLQAMNAAVEQVVEKLGRLDVVVANAGVAARGATLRVTSPDVIERLFAINVHGAVNTLHASLPQIIENRGNVVLISSVFAYLNGAGTLPYAMSKAAVEQLGRGLRVELASYGVDVTTAYFSMIDTDMIRQSVDQDTTAQALLAGLPSFLNKRISPSTAARSIVAGIEHGKPRVMRPRRWVPLSIMRGPLAVALDAKMHSDKSTQALLRDLDGREGQDRLTS